MTLGSWPKRSAIFVAMMRQSSRYLALRPVELLAVTVLILAAVGHGAEGFGIFLREPGGRRGGGCADDDGDVVLFGEADGVLEPVELVVALGGLHGGPGELADAGEVDVRLLHER